jgi:hypothetical protein
MRELKGVVDILKDRQVNPPEFLYKYCALGKWTPNLFQDNELYFQSPNAFNDPFDSVVRFVCEGSRSQRKRYFRVYAPHYDPNLSRHRALSLERQFKTGSLDDASIRGRQKGFRKIRDRMGVLCLTEKKDNILMWSHYAWYHTGFCIEFKTDDPFFSQVHPVKYTDTLPCMNLLLNWDESVVSHAEALLTKAVQWEYEHEWRIIDINRENGVGVHQFPATALHGVILGCRIKPENRSRIVEWCRARQPQPVLYQAKQKEAEFGLDFVGVEY